MWKKTKRRQTQLINNVQNNDVAVELSSSLGIGTSVVGSEKNVGNSNFDQSFGREMRFNDETSTTVIMETQNLGNGSCFGGPVNREFVEENIKDIDAFSNENIEGVEITSKEVDHLISNHAHIHSAVKSLQGKKKRKTINDILGFSKIKPVCTNTRGGGRNKNKCVVLRSAVAAAALSASVSSEGINNRNRILLDEAQAIWAINKMHGITYDGDEQEVINKIAELEAKDKGRAECLL